MLGQDVEIPEDVVFTVEYPVRGAMHVVCELLGIDKEMPGINHGLAHPKVAVEALRTALGERAPRSQPACQCRSHKSRSQKMSTQLAGDERRVVLELDGLQWASETRAVEAVLGRQPGVLAVTANPVAQTATVTYDPARTTVRAPIIACSMRSIISTLSCVIISSSLGLNSIDKYLDRMVDIISKQRETFWHR